MTVTFRWHAWALPLGVLVARGYWSVAIGPWTFEHFSRQK